MAVVAIDHRDARADEARDREHWNACLARGAKLALAEL
jgi:hypothetical protein